MRCGTDGATWGGMSNIIDESDLECALIDLLKSESDNGDSDFAGCKAQSFKAARVLTMNNGIVIRMPNGAEFQVTIVQSEEAK